MAGPSTRLSPLDTSGCVAKKSNNATCPAEPEYIGADNVKVKTVALTKHCVETIEGANDKGRAKGVLAFMDAVIRLLKVGFALVSISMGRNDRPYVNHCGWGRLEWDMG